MKLTPVLTLFVLIAILTAGGGTAMAAEGSMQSAQSRGGPPMGVAVTPRNFPSHTLRDVDDAFRLSRGLGNQAVFIFQWGKFDLGIARLMIEKSRAAGLVPVLGLSPTTLDRKRKELDVPDDVRRRIGEKVSFGNPVVRKAFMKAARDLARLEPAFLCLATEINFLALQRLPEYLRFASLYKEAYREVKRISPRTQVFVTFQWEWVRILDAKEPHRIRDHSKVIDIFRPELDLVGFTTYPSPFHTSPGALPGDYYTWAFHHIRRTEPVLFMEVGWPTSGSGSAAEQVAFIRRLPELLRGMNVVGLDWSLLHDVGLAEFDADLNTTGLITSRGVRKPGYQAFERLRSAFR